MKRERPSRICSWTIRAPGYPTPSSGGLSRPTWGQERWRGRSISSRDFSLTSFLLHGRNRSPSTWANTILIRKTMEMRQPPSAVFSESILRTTSKNGSISCWGNLCSMRKTIRQRWRPITRRWERRIRQNWNLRFFRDWAMPTIIQRIMKGLSGTGTGSWPISPTFQINMRFSTGSRKPPSLPRIIGERPGMSIGCRGTLSCTPTH